MKRFFLPLLTFLFCFNGLSAQTSCLPTGITITTQAQIDNFRMNYPNCTEIVGDMKFIDPDNISITNFDSLSGVTLINGSLEFELGCSATDISAFSNLSKIGNNLTIEGHLTGDFSALDSITEQLSWEGNISSCTSLLTNFTALRYVGNIYISSAAQDSFALNDFPLLERVENDLDLGYSFYLCGSYCNFPSLEYIGGTAYLGSESAGSGFEELVPSALNFTCHKMM